MEITAHVYIHGDDQPSPIERKLDSIMADTAALKAAVASLADAQHATHDEFAKLVAKIDTLEAGATLSQADVDELTTSVTNIAGALSADVAGVEPAPPAPPVDTPPT